MARARRRGWKGCCLMCAYGHGKVRGQSRGEREPFAVVRQVGKKRRLRRGDLGDQD